MPRFNFLFFSVCTPSDISSQIIEHTQPASEAAAHQVTGRPSPDYSGLKSPKTVFLIDPPNSDDSDIRGQIVEHTQPASEAAAHQVTGRPSPDYSGLKNPKTVFLIDPPNSDDDNISELTEHSAGYLDDEVCSTSNTENPHNIFRSSPNNPIELREEISPVQAQDAIQVERKSRSLNI